MTQMGRNWLEEYFEQMKIMQGSVLGPLFFNFVICNVAKRGFFDVTEIFMKELCCSCDGKEF